MSTLFGAAAVVAAILPLAVPSGARAASTPSTTWTYDGPLPSEPVVNSGPGAAGGGVDPGCPSPPVGSYGSCGWGQNYPGGQAAVLTNEPTGNTTQCHKGGILVESGYNGTTFSHSVACYMPGTSSAQGSAVQFPPTVTAHYEGELFYMPACGGGEVIAANGATDAEAATNTYEVLSFSTPVGGAWTSAGLVPGGPRFHGAMVTLADGSVLVAGGYSDPTTQIPNTSSAVFGLDCQWHQGGAISSVGRSYYAARFTGDKGSNANQGLFCGGTISNATPVGAPSSTDYSCDTFTYTPAPSYSVTWQLKSPGHINQTQGYMVGLPDGKILVAGGFCDTFASPSDSCSMPPASSGMTWASQLQAEECDTASCTSSPVVSGTTYTIPPMPQPGHTDPSGAKAANGDYAGHVIICGGFGYVGDGTVYYASSKQAENCEWYVPPGMTPVSGECVNQTGGTTATAGPAWCMNQNGFPSAGTNNEYGCPYPVANVAPPTSNISFAAGAGQQPSANSNASCGASRADFSMVADPSDNSIYALAGLNDQGVSPTTVNLERRSVERICTSVTTTSCP